VRRLLAVAWEDAVLAELCEEFRLAPLAFAGDWTAGSLLGSIDVQNNGEA
jgi:hypothetical protein